MYDDDESEEEELDEQTFADEYEDREGENLAPTVEDEHLAVKAFECPACGKKTREVARLVPPLCPNCGEQMTAVHKSQVEEGFEKLLAEVRKKKTAAPSATVARARPKPKPARKPPAKTPAKALKRRNRASPRAKLRLARKAGKQKK